MDTLTLGILSDIHYASTGEHARGNDYEYRGLRNPFMRALVKLHRRYFWLREPLNKNYLLDRFLETVKADRVVALGDYTCNSAFVGVSDTAACQSARECLQKLREKFGSQFHACFGDHELGKFSLLGKQGGMRLESWRRATEELRLEPFWQITIGNYLFIGVTSSLIELPLLASEMLPGERSAWEKLRETHMQAIREAFTNIPPTARVLLFCHDPTALSFLWREEPVRRRLAQVESTIIGHLHSTLIWKWSRLLSGMPVISFLGHSARRLSAALRDAKNWRHFKVRLCPSLAGIELLKDGGYLTASLDLDGRAPAGFQLHRLPR